MRIQNIQTNNYLSQNKYQSRNNSQPSFQHLVIISKDSWDKNILKSVLHNRELKKFENYLEKRNSVLELNLSSHDFGADGDKKHSIDCIYDRHSHIEGAKEIIVPPTQKESFLKKLKSFKASDIIRRIEEKEHVEIAKIEKHIKELEMPKKKSFLEKILNLF